MVSKSVRLKELSHVVFTDYHVFFVPSDYPPLVLEDTSTIIAQQPIFLSSSLFESTISHETNRLFAFLLHHCSIIYFILQYADEPFLRTIFLGFWQSCIFGNNQASSQTE